MAILVLYDTPQNRNAVYPLSLTRPLADLRLGIFTIRQWWHTLTGLPVFALSEDYLQEPIPGADRYVCVDASVVGNALLAGRLITMEPGQVLEDDNGLIAFCTNALPQYQQLPVWPEQSISAAIQLRISHSWNLFQYNASLIESQFSLLFSSKGNAVLSATNTVIGNGGLYLEEGVTMEACVINTTEGPVYIGKNALVMEGTLIRGPVAICEGAVIKMGTRLYPGTTIGPYCTAGGEIKNSILTGYSNKAHDGYLGDSVVGEWCNFGAGSSNSNVKNTGGPVKMWDQQSRSLQQAGNKAGLIMGDYSRCAINSSINTGTTIGVSCNLFDGTYPPKHLPSFSWGSHERYDFEKACRDAANWKKMKSEEFTAKDRLILQRVWENEQ